MKIIFALLVISSTTFAGIEKESFKLTNPEQVLIQGVSQNLLFIDESLNWGLAKICFRTA